MAKTKKNYNKELKKILKEVLVVGSDGGSINFGKNIHNKFLYKTSESNYGLDDVKPINKQSEAFVTFTEALNAGIKEYPSLLRLYPVRVSDDIKAELLVFVDDFFTDKEDMHYKKWIDKIEE